MISLGLARGTDSVPSGIIDFAKSGCGWGDGIPSPTVDCIAGPNGQLICNVNAGSGHAISTDGDGYQGQTSLMSAGSWYDGGAFASGGASSGKCLISPDNFVTSQTFSYTYAGADELIVSPAIPATWTGILSAHSIGPIIYGTPTTVDSPYYPNGFNNPAQPAVKLASAMGDYYSVGTLTPAASTGLTVFGKFIGYIPTANEFLFGADGGITNRCWAVNLNTNFGFIIFGSGSYSYMTTLASTVQWNVFACSYQYVTDGTSVMRMNFNGTAVSALTNAHGPINTAVPQAVVLGVYTQIPGSFNLNGAVAEIGCISNFSASDAQLAAMVQSQMGLLSGRP